jgi:hypothetical protein
MFNTVLSSRADNRGVLQHFSKGKVPTPFPGNSPFNSIIKSSYGVRKSRNSKMGEYTRDKNNLNADMWKTSDGLFAKGLGTPYGGRGELWQYSGTNNSDVTSKFSTVQSIQSDWVAAETIDDGLKTQEVADAMLFLPTIFRKLVEYENNLKLGVTSDPRSVFTDIELAYIRTLPKDRDVLRKMLFQVNEERIKQKLEPLVIPGIAAAGIEGAASAAAAVASATPVAPVAPVDDSLDEGKVRLFITSMVGDDEKEIDRKSTPFYKSIETDNTKLVQAFVLLGKIQKTVQQGEKDVIDTMLDHISHLTPPTPSPATSSSTPSPATPAALAASAAARSSKKKKIPQPVTRP